MTDEEPDDLHERVTRIMEGMDDEGPGTSARLCAAIEGATVDTFLRETDLSQEDAWELVNGITRTGDDHGSAG